MKQTRLVSVLLVLLVTAATACLSPAAEGNLVPATVDDDPSLPRVALNGSLFHAETFGDPSAPVIVVIHGGPGHDYRGLLRLRRPVDGVRLEDRHFVVFWDQRGTGLSRRHDPDEVTLESYEADLAALLDRFSPGRQVVFIAQSWGGMFATDFIAKHPDRVAGAVLKDPGPLTSVLFDEVKDGIRKLDLFSEWLNDYGWGQSVVSPDDHARADYALLLGQLADSQPGYHLSTTDREPLFRLGAVPFFELQRAGMESGWDFTKGLEHFQRPVLFEATALNEVLGADFQRRQMALYPRAELAIVPGGHDGHWTHPEGTLRPILAYLDAIGF